MGPDTTSPEEMQVRNQSTYAALDRRADENPHDQKTWDEIIDLARNEKQKGVETFLPDVPLEEMIAVGRQLQHTKTQDERYHLLLQQAPNGALWYDIIHPANREMLGPVSSFLAKEVAHRWEKFNRGLDLGCGSGNAASVIAPYCKSTVGMDLLYESVRAASGRKDLGHFQGIRGDATALPFAAESFDLVISNGLTSYFSRFQERKQNEEIDRILTPGGMYTTVWANAVNEPIHGAKNLLQNIMSWMITSAISDNQMDERELIAQFTEKGYNTIRYRRPNENLVMGFRKK